MTTPSTTPFYDDKEQSPIVVEAEQYEKIRFVFNDNGGFRIYCAPVMIDIHQVLEFLNSEQVNTTQTS